MVGNVVLDALEIAGHLRAKLAGRGRVCGIAGNLGGDALAAPQLRRDEHRAGIGAIVRAGRPNDDTVECRFGGHGAS